MTRLARACKVCSSPDRDRINEYMANRQSVNSIARWLVAEGRPISRPVLQKHLRHALDERSGYVEAHPPTKIKTVSSSEFLQTVVNVAAANVDKRGASVDQGIRAAQILEAKKDNTRDGLRVLALVLMGRAPDTIQGEYRELPSDSESALP